MAVRSSLRAARCRMSLAEMGMVRDIAVDGGRVAVTLVLTSPVCWQAGNIIQAVEASVSRLPRVTAVTCTVDHDAGWLPGQMDPRARQRLRSVRPVPDPATARATAFDLDRWDYEH